MQPRPVPYTLPERLPEESNSRVRVTEHGGQLRERERRFPVVVRAFERAQSLGDLPIILPAAIRLPAVVTIVAIPLGDADPQIAGRFSSKPVHRCD